MDDYEFTRVYNETPVVQFKTLGHFIADLAAGQITTVYHDLSEGDYHSAPWTSSFRAIVHEDKKPHIASLTFRRPLHMVAGPREPVPMEYDGQRAYQEDEHAELVSIVAVELEIIAGEELGALMIREGLIDLPFWVQVAYARRPKAR